MRRTAQPKYAATPAGQALAVVEGVLEPAAARRGVTYQQLIDLLCNPIGGERALQQAADEARVPVSGELRRLVLSTLAARARQAERPTVAPTGRPLNSPDMRIGGVATGDVDPFASLPRT